ncbi:hypothetical protein Daus18300_001779 [Diaporthe australafricana]|uniref:2EXR domain-containing protein n=1 Tax=Diaporthe australafricana TaxID=127596 RepID=A0ABR3XU33_9PEZI
MDSAIVTQSQSPDIGMSADAFHCFPILPPELRLRIWQIAYDSIPNIEVYRFRLEFRPSSLFGLDDDEIAKLEESEEQPSEAYLVPLEEVSDLTRDLRNLRRVNAEARYESQRLFDSYLRLNQTHQGWIADSEICVPINLPWKADRNFFCLVEPTSYDLICLNRASTSLIDQVFETVRLLGFGLDRDTEFGLDFFEEYEDFAQLILRFQNIQHVALVSDQLMSESDLDDIHNDHRSVFCFSSWYDWVGRVDENVMDSYREDAVLVTQGDHLESLQTFVFCLWDYGEAHPESAKVLSTLRYGMLFRTKEDLDFLLFDDEFWAEIFPDEMFMSSDGMPGLEISSDESDDF